MALLLLSFIVFIDFLAVFYLSKIIQKYIAPLATENKGNYTAGHFKEFSKSQGMAFLMFMIIMTAAGITVAYLKIFVL